MKSTFLIVFLLKNKNAHKITVKAYKSVIVKLLHVLRDHLKKILVYIYCNIVITHLKQNGHSGRPAFDGIVLRVCLSIEFRFQIQIEQYSNINGKHNTRKYTMGIF